MSKKIVALLVWWCVPAFCGTYYVDCNRPNDSGAGTSPATAWKTVAKVNGTSLQPGDSVLFVRGCSWNETLTPSTSGASGNAIKFDAYGSGAPPTLTGQAKVGTWTNSSGNVWYTALTVSMLNNVQFNGKWWGTKQASQVAVANPYDWFLDPVAYRLYVYAAGNPGSYYSAVSPVVMTATQLIHVASKTNLEFQHFALTMFPNYGVEVDGTSDNVTFANLYVDSTVPNAVLPHGFYVHTTTNPVHLCLWNIDANRNYDGFRFDNVNGAVDLKNIRAYANRNKGIEANTSTGVTYSYSHFYANGIGILGTQDVTGATDGGGNVAAYVQPNVEWAGKYVPRISFTVDDEGKTPGGADFIDSILPEFNLRSVKLSIAVTTGEQFAQGDIPRIQGWLNAGHDINSHSWSHAYYDTAAFSVKYNGTGTAATLTISGNTLTTTVTGGLGGENHSVNLANTGYNTWTALAGVINAWPNYSASLIGAPFALSVNLADVAAVDIKTATYNVMPSEARLIPSEMAMSKAWLQSNLTGLPGGLESTYVYPAGKEDASTEGYAVAAGYTGSRGALSMPTTYVLAGGSNVQNIASFGLSGLHGMTRKAIHDQLAQVAWKSAVWGTVYGIFCHPGELTPDEVGWILDGVRDGGADLMTNAQEINWLNAQTNLTGTMKVANADGPENNFAPTVPSPAYNAGFDTGDEYETDINGVARTTNDLGSIAVYTVKLGGTAGGTSAISGFMPTPLSFFGMHLNALTDDTTPTPYPDQPVGARRNFGIRANWWSQYGGIETGAQGAYDFSRVDKWITQALTANPNTEFFYTVFGTPPYYSASCVGGTCAACSGGNPTGQCDPPSCYNSVCTGVLNADGSGSDQPFINFITALANHVIGSGPAAGKKVAQVVKYWEPWNEPTLTSYWTGTQAQLVRMASDLRTVVKAINPKAVITTPCPVGTETNSASTWLAGYLPTVAANGATGSSVADAISFHGYQNNNKTDPERIVDVVSNIRSVLTGADIAKQIVDSEFSWNLDTGVPTQNMRAAVVARHFILHRWAGLAASHWFGWDYRDQGTLWGHDNAAQCGGMGAADQGGFICLAGTAYGQVETWLKGNRVTNCAVNGRVWSCTILKANGAQTLAVWDTSKGCVNEVCSTTAWGYDSRYVHYYDLAGGTYALAGGTVQVGAKPILLTTE
jgi:hypothetical protein